MHLAVQLCQEEIGCELWVQVWVAKKVSEEEGLFYF